MFFMDGKLASAKTGLTYGQTNYLVRKGLITPISISQGKPREFSYRDLVMLRLAAELRADGYRLDAISQALTELRTHWTSENPEEAGWMLVIGGFFVWVSETPTISDKEGKTKTHLGPYPRHIYYVTGLAWQVEDV